MSNFTGKGSWVRPSSIDKKEKELREELFWDKPTEERKKEIKKQLEEMKNG